MWGNNDRTNFDQYVISFPKKCNASTANYYEMILNSAWYNFMIVRRHLFD